MAINDLGIVRPGSKIVIPWATFDSNDPSASVAIAALVLADVGIYKSDSMTERGSTTGVVLLETDGIDIDGAVGIGGISIDLASNATDDFYNVGDQYYVTLGPVTVDAGVINGLIATFRIGYPGAIHETNIATLDTQVSFTLDIGSADNGAYVGCPAYIHDIASAIQVCFGYVSAYTGSTKTVTLKADPGVFAITAGDNISLFPPANVQAVAGTTQTAGDLSALIATAQADLDLLAGTDGATLATTQGNYAPSKAGDAMTLETAAITAAVMATDSVDAAALSTDAVQAIADSVKSRQMAEGYAADTVAPTVEQMLFMIWSYLNEASIVSVTKTSKKLDGSTTAMTHTLDDDTNPTSVTRAT